MSATITTQVLAVTINEVPDEEIDELLDEHEAETFEEAVESMEEDVATLLAKRFFGDADEVPIVSVECEVERE